MNEVKKQKKEERRKKKVLLGSLKGFSEGVIRLFELTTSPSSRCSNDHLFQAYTGTALDAREIQTFPAWKVQNDFRKLHFRQRKRLKRKVVYLQPIGPFPTIVHDAVQGFNCPLFQLLETFMAAFFHGMPVRLQETILLDKINCKTRLHPVTSKLQLLVKDVLAFLKSSLPPDGFCIVGITWVDLYPGDEWNFVLGEASCDDGCAVISFGHYEPQTYTKKISQNTKVNSVTNRELSSPAFENVQPLSQFGDAQKSETSFTQEFDTEPQNAGHVDGSEFDKLVEGASRAVKTSSNCSSSLQVGETSGDLEASKNEIISTGNAGHKKPFASVGFDKNQSEAHQVVVTSDQVKELDRIDQRIIWRLFRGISHETCHITGMAHCAYYACAMNESKSVQEAESQPLFMCPVCLRKLQKAVGFDIVQRYKVLQAFFTSVCNSLSTCDDQGEKLFKPQDVCVSQHAIETRSFCETNFEASLVWLQSVLEFIRNDGE